MKNTFIIGFLLVIGIKGSAQSVLNSAQIIERYANDKTKYDTAQRELAYYVKWLNTQNPASNGVQNKTRFHSAYLKKYYLALNRTRNNVLDSITLGLIISPDLATKTLIYRIVKKDSTSSTISNTLADTTLSETLNRINSPGSDLILKHYGIIRDSLISKIDLLFKNKVQSLRNTNSTQIIKDTEKNLFKDISVVPKKDNTNNLNFEVSNLSAAVQGGIKLPSESEVIDAMAIFIASRIKEETVMAFMEQVGKNLNKIEPLPCLFKNTVKELEEYSPGAPVRFGSILKKAIANDIANMPDNIVNCSSCKDAGNLNSFRHFTSFFNDLSDGVDLITNIDYYAEQVKDTNARFNSALQVFRFVNHYFSHLDDKNALSTWISPDSFKATPDSTLKLGLSLIYEKETALFQGFLKRRYLVDDLDAFVGDSAKFNMFRKNFTILLYKLHWLDSYWQSNKQGNKAVVNMSLYTEKVTEVFKTLYTILTYTTPGNFPTDNESYNNYQRAKIAVVKKDFETVVYESQKLIDLLSCYKINLPALKLPHFNFDIKTAGCVSPKAQDIPLINSLQVTSKVSLSDLLRLHNAIKNDTVLTTISSAFVCNHFTKFKMPAFKITSYGFMKHLHLFDSLFKLQRYHQAMDLKFRPWVLWHLPMLVFDHKDWKLALHLWHLRIRYRQHTKASNNVNYTCYLNAENLNTKLSYNGARRDVSQILNLFSDVSKAKGSGELSKVIEEYAEPPQSYKIKRFNSFSLDVNAFPGVYLAAETKAGYNLITKTSTNNLTSAVWGITAPIGFTFSWGGRIAFKCSNANRYPSFITKRGKIRSFRGGCFSATLVGIDIGAVVSYRFSSDSSKALPKSVNFSQVLAPGFLLGYGIPGLPLVINLGCQYTPQLRTFESFGNAPLDAYRVSFSIAYDIPFLNISNTTKRNKKLKN